MSEYIRRPDWIKLKPINEYTGSKTKITLDRLNLSTVCEKALCPNRPECFSSGIATFLILGEHCTRHCKFCAMNEGKLSAPDPEEPDRICEAVKILKLRRVVITSVTRDDLPDGGSFQFAKTIKLIRDANPECKIEVLIPDFKDNFYSLETVIKASPAILAHNIDTVPRLFNKIRPQANYERSLKILKETKLIDNKIVTKSGLMLGLGEEKDDVIRVMLDLMKTKCDMLTISQYLQPSSKHYPIVRYVQPSEFENLKKIGIEMGFGSVMSGPLIRSSIASIA